jgi:hypothetical protein
MFRFDIVKPEIREVIQEKQQIKESLRNVFFYNLLELERLRNHVDNLESDIDYEKDLYRLLRIGDRKMATNESIKKRRKVINDILPLLLKVIMKEFTENRDVDKWDYIILLEEEEFRSFLSGDISYRELVKNLNIK